MNLLEDIRSFCKAKLRSVETKVRNADGRESIETRDPMTGSLRVRALSGSQSPGFVKDLNPDLQVAYIVPGLSLGSQDVAHELCLLKRHHVTHILNLATGIPNTFEENGAFVYKRIEILDLPDQDILSILPECFAFIDSAVALEGQPHGKSGHVFVHCNAGISRSASVVIAYLMRTSSLSFDQAFGLVKSVRGVVRPNYGFIRQLREYEKELERARSASFS